MPSAPVQPLSPQHSKTISGLEGCGRSEAAGKRGDESMEAEVLPAEEGEEGEIVAPEQDVQPLKTLPTPVLPSQADIDEHNIDHNPYRSWCNSCVCGQGREAAHGRQEPGRRHISVVSFDYFFVAKKGMFSKKEWEAGAKSGEVDFLKVLVVKESLNKCVFAHAVERKGDDDGGYVVECVVRDIEWLGYSRVILKSDNEPAIVKVLRESLKSLRVEGIEQAAEEHSPPYDPQANGEIEQAVGAVKGKSRTIVHALEQRIGRKVPPTHPIMTWLMENVAAGMCRRNRGGDGMTPYRRVQGRPFYTK